MPTKREIEDKARPLIDTSPLEAVALYEQIWKDFADDFNEWDAFFYVKAIRNTKTTNSSIWDVVEKFKNEEKVVNIYLWYVFDNYIKKRSKQEILKFEKIIIDSLQIGKQKDLSENQDFPCPFTIAVFNLIGCYTENLFNAKKVVETLGYLDPEILSPIARTINSEQRGEMDMASDKEKYYALMTKGLLKNGDYAQCLDLSEKALTLFEKFHHNNDLWFKMRTGICHEKLGDSEQSEQTLSELVASKAGSDKWFLYRDISDIYYEQENFEKAWKYSVDAAYYGNEPKYMINLYLQQARLLYKLDRKDEGELLAKLIFAIIKENQWNIKPEFSKVFKFYGVDDSDSLSVDQHFKIAQKFWIAERYKGIERQTGTIKWIHNNGKMGKILDSHGYTVLFSKKDFRNNMRNISDLLDASVEFYPMKNYKKDSIAEDIIVLRKEKKDTKTDDLVGKTIKGKIRAIKDFGIFVKFSDVKDGLIHKSKLPKNLKEDFQAVFNEGDEITVEVNKVTTKGLELKYNK